MDDLLADFLTECLDGLARLEVELVRLERQPDDAQLVAGIFRVIHSIKGTCGFFGLKRLVSVAHAAESVLARVRDRELRATAGSVALVLTAVDRIRLILEGLAANGAEPPGNDSELTAALERTAAGGAMDGAPARSACTVTEAGSCGIEPFATPSLRIRADLLEELANLVGELAATRNELLQLTPARADDSCTVPLQRLSRITAALQAAVTRARLQPVGNAWTRLPRLVRDLGSGLGKQIELRLGGGEIELDRGIVELIRDPLLHLVRNAADHGLETPAERRLAGKPERGTITVEACHEGGGIVIRVTDDGRGLDAGRIRATALAEGRASPAELAAMSDAEALRLILAPGLSTAPQVTRVSGRGVGMDVVRTNVGQIGGTVELACEPGRRTVVTLRLPSTLAVVPAPTVGVAGQRFAIPQDRVIDIVQADGTAEQGVELVGGVPILRRHGEPLPLVSLATALSLRPPPPLSAAAPVQVAGTSAGARLAGIAIDQILHAEDIVARPLAPILRSIRGVSGIASLGDGNVAMSLGRLAVVDSRAFVPGAGVAMPAERAGQACADKTRFLLTARDRGPKIVSPPRSPQAEKADASRMRSLCGRTVAWCGGQPVPRIDADGASLARNSGRKPALRPKDTGPDVGSAADAVFGIEAPEHEGPKAPCRALAPSAKRPGRRPARAEHEPASGPPTDSHACARDGPSSSLELRDPLLRPQKQLDAPLRHAMADPP